MMNPPSLKRYWVGIDPGFEGAIGVIDTSGNFVLVEDIPSTGEEGRGREFDLVSLRNIIRRIMDYRVTRVLLEYPTTRPGESPESSKRFGVGLGLLDGMFTYAGATVGHVAPNRWKSRLGLKGKDSDPYAARLQAVESAETFIRGLPAGALRGSRGGLKDGRAEALLIAWEGLTATREGLLRQPKDVRMARLLMGSGKRRRKAQDF